MTLSDSQKAGRGEIWTLDRVDTLKRLWSEGLTCSEIALVLGEGATRNAVIGKVHRLKLERRRMRYNPSGRNFRTSTLRPRKLRSVRRIKLKAQPNSRPPEQPPLPPPLTRAWEPLPGSLSLSLLDLNDSVCRWPTGGSSTIAGTAFCGCPVLKGRPYCPDHYATSIGKGTSFERAAEKTAKLAIWDERQTEPIAA
jgi:GcrA cell cycle regulator